MQSKHLEAEGIHGQIHIAVYEVGTLYTPKVH